MGTKGWIIFVAVAVLLLGGLIYFSSQNRLDVSDIDATTIIEATEKNGNIGDHVFGNRNSQIVFIEYGDYQCPGCGSAYERVKAVTEKYQDQIAFVFRNLPLTSIHPNARAAAAAAEAAGKQDKYWEMHDVLFANQEAWSGASASERTDVFRGYAREIGLNIEQFDTDIVADVINQKINFDLALARSINATSTPTFILGGESVGQDIWSNDEALDTFIREKIVAAGIALPDNEAAE